MLNKFKIYKFFLAAIMSAVAVFLLTNIFRNFESVNAKNSSALSSPKIERKTFESQSGMNLEVESITTESAKLTASDGALTDFFGGATAISNNTAVLGAGNAAINGNIGQGAAYVFVGNGTSWSQQAKLVASDGTRGDAFGYSVAIDGNITVVGAAGEDIGPEDGLDGAVYVFVRNGSVWDEQAKLVPADRNAGAQFGESVSVHNNTIIVGAPRAHSDQNTYSGAAYVFVFNGTQWVQQAKLTASDNSSSDNFGRDVSIDGDTAVVSASFDDVGSNNNQGSAYVFTRNGSVWNEQSILRSSDGRAGDFFGNSIAVSGDSVVVGAWDNDPDSVFNQGAAYIFTRNGNNWLQQSKLTASDGAIGDNFGSGVDISGDTVVIGASGNDIDGKFDRGSAYVFVRDGANWAEITQLRASDGAKDERFGTQVAIDQNKILVGAPEAKISNVPKGAGYFFIKPTSAPDLQAASDSGVSSSDNITQDRTPSFDIRGVTVGATVQLLRNDTVVASVTADSITISLTDDTAPADGTFKYVARQIIDNEVSSPSTTLVTIDTTAPVITINQVPYQRDPTSANFVEFAFTLSEPLPGFDAQDISLAGSTADVSAANITVMDRGSFHQVFVNNILSDGIIRVSVPSGTIQDLAGNFNPDSNNEDNTVTRDTVGATVMINQATDQADPTAALPLKFKVVFSEPVSGFERSDISTVGSTTVVPFTYITVTGSGAEYTILVNDIISNGQVVRLSIPMGVVRDAADNPNFASTSDDNQVTVDNVPPTVTVNQAPGQSDPASSQPISFRVVFSEPVTGFNAEDVLLVGSTADVSLANVTVTGGGATYNVTVGNIISSGQVKISLAENAAQDGLGNLSKASTSTDNTITVNVRRAQFDFDGDGKSDISVFRPDNGAWYLNRSHSGFAGIQFGISTDRLVPADYDGDGKTDIAVYRNGYWYLLRSTAGFAAVSFGLAEDIPQPADFDGDGKAELAVYRPSPGSWYMLNLVNNQSNAVQFGVASDKPVVGDYDGDGKADYAVFRPESGTWYLLQSTAGFAGVQFGITSDKPVPADYDGDGKIDIAVFREGIWYLLQSTSGFAGFQFGIATDKPAPADYDGDGKAAAAVFRDGNWYLLGNTNGFTAVQFGISTDQPVPSVFVQ